MVRYRNRCDSFVNGTPSVIARQDAFDDERTLPKFANPSQVCPRHSGARQCGIDIDKWHRSLAWDDNIRKRGQTAVAQETDQPTRMCQYFWKKRDLLQKAATDEFFHAVPVVALADSGDRCVDGNDQCREPRNPCSFNHSFGGTATAHEIELIQNRTGGTCLYVLQLVDRNRRKNIGGACCTGCSRCCHFATRMHEAAVAHGREQEWERKVEAQHACAQIAMGNGNRMTWPERHVLKDAAILSERDLAFGAAIEIVEDPFRNSATRHRPEIVDANDAGRCYSARRPSRAHGHRPELPCTHRSYAVTSPQKPSVVICCGVSRTSSITCSGSLRSAPTACSM